MAIAIVAVVARVAVQIALGFYTHPESWEYDVVARNLASGHGYQMEYLGTTYQALVTPPYPLLLAALYLVFGLSPVPIGLMQAAIGGALAAAAYRLGAVASPSRPVAIVAGGLVALHPGLLVYSAKIHSLPFDALLTLVLVLVFVRLGPRPSTRSIVILGLAIGLAVLERQTLLPFVVVVLAARWLLTRPRRIVREAVLVTALATLVIGPWIVRNQLVLGEPALLSTGGEALWLGNNPVAPGGAMFSADVAVIDAVPEVRDEIWGRPEPEQDRAFRSMALAYMATDPLGTLARTGLKLARFWWFGAQTGALYPQAWTIAYVAYYVVIAMLAAVGALTLARGMRARRLLLLIFALFASVSLAHAVTYVDGRHRWMIEPLLLVLAAVGCAAVTRPLLRLWGRAWPRSAGTADAGASNAS